MVKPVVDAIASIIDATLNFVFQLPLARIFFLAQVWHIGLGLRKVLKKVLKKALKKILLTQKRTQKSKCTFLSTQKSTQ